MSLHGDAARVRDRYRRFAMFEAPGRSPLYADWAAGVTADPSMCALLARIPAAHRQPPLLFAVTRLLGAPEEAFPSWAAWLRENADAVVAECGRRSLQTNEPLRCAALLPALSRIAGPIALLEVGASAGLCLYPDRYSYRYRSPSRTVAVDPDPAGSAVVLDCAVADRMPPVRLPDVVWRAGIDLHPLDAGDPADREWLTGLVWPGEQGRVARIEAALDIVAGDPPILLQADAADGIADLARDAPADATLVVTTPGVLAHVAPPGRERIIEAARAAGRWITLDDPALHDGWRGSFEGSEWPDDGFALALDGEVLAVVDPLGGWLEWRA